MLHSPLADFLCPAGFAGPRGTARPRPRGQRRERGGPPTGAARPATGCTGATPYAVRGRPSRATSPVMLVPGFMAGDCTLDADGAAPARARATAPTARRSSPTSAAPARPPGARAPHRADRGSRGRKVTIVGHSLGGMMARGLAARRPDLVAGIVTMGSPILAPGAAHPILLSPVVLTRLQRRRPRPDDGRGLHRRRVRAADVGRVARAAARGFRFTSVYSRRDGIVDWRALHRPAGEARRGAHQPHRHGVRPGRARRRRRGARRAPRPARPASVSRQARLAAVPSASAG